MRRPENEDEYAEGFVARLLVQIPDPRRSGFLRGDDFQLTRRA